MASKGMAMTPTPANTMNRIQLKMEVTATTYTGNVVRTLQVSDGTPPRKVPTAHTHITG